MRDRVNFVLYVYSKWIQFTKSEYEQNEDGDGAMTMNVRQRIDVVDLMDNELPGNYQFIDFQTDFNRILKNNDLLKQRTDTETIFDAECSSTNCHILRRHQRPKAFYSRNEHKMDSLFFVNNNGNDDDKRKAVVIQDVLDSVHHFMKHRDSIDMQQIMERVQSENAPSVNKENDEDIDVDELCKDQLAIALDRELTERRTSGRNRGRGIEQEQFNKFMTTNSYISTVTNTKTLDDHDDDKKEDDTEQKVNVEQEPKQESEEEIECEDCFVEQLYNELHLH